MKGDFVANPRHPLTGRQFTVRARSQRELEAYLHRIDSLKQELRLSLTTPEQVDLVLRRLRHGVITLERAAQSYALREDLAPNTRRRIESAMAGPLAKLAGHELEALDGARLGPHFRRISRELARASVWTVWRTLRAIMRHAAEKGWIGRTPWGTWSPRAGAGQKGRETRECARSLAELEELLDAAHWLDHQGEYRALRAKIACGALLGLRQGELAGLRWYDLDTRERVVAIRRQWDGRPLKAGDGSGVAPLDASFWTILRVHHDRMVEVLGFTPLAGHPVFPAPNGKHYSAGECLATSGLRQSVERATLNAPSRWSPHSLRDTFVLLAAKAHGGDLVKVAQLARHASVASLVRYLRAWERSHAATLPELPP